MSIKLKHNASSNVFQSKYYSDGKEPSFLLFGFVRILGVYGFGLVRFHFHLWC